MSWLRKQKNVIIAVIATVLLVGCGGAVAESVDDAVSGVVGKQNRIYFDNQPIPIFDYSAQRDTVTQIYNATIPVMPNTWTVFYSQTGVITDICTSKGTPIPYGVSLTSSEYMKTDGNGQDAATSVDLPQPEPSGLYTDGITTTATWVLCNFNGNIEPVYAEDIAKTYFHPVEIGPDGRIVHLTGPASVTINVKE